MGLFVAGNPGGPGRPRGSKNMLPLGSRKMMTELIAGRLTQDGRPIATIMVDLFFQGLEGAVVLRRNAKTTTYVSPVAFLKLFLDYMLKVHELALKAKAAKKNSKRSGGGIRIVLPSVPADPLLRPGQKPRPLRLLGQDPDKPLSDTTGTATKTPAPPGPVPAQTPLARAGGWTGAESRRASN